MDRPRISCALPPKPLEPGVASHPTRWTGEVIRRGVPTNDTASASTCPTGSLVARGSPMMPFHPRE